MFLHATETATGRTPDALDRHSALTAWLSRTGAFGGVRSASDPTTPSAPFPSGKGELTFLGDALERFRRALDPILAVVAFSRQLPDHLIRTAGGRTRDVARRKVHGRSNREFVLQRPLHQHEFAASRLRSRARLAGK